MSNVETSTSTNEPGETTTAGETPQELREAARLGREARDRNAQLEREMAFMRAGIDTTSKPAQAMIASYSGDLTDRDALLAEAAEWQLAPAGTAPTTDPTPDPNSAELLQQQTREQLASGGVADKIEQPPVRGRERVLEDFKADRGRMHSSAAINQAFTNMIAEGATGQKSALFDPAEHAKQAEMFGHGAEFNRG